jgi:hypothetical protein
VVQSGHPFPNQVRRWKRRFQLNRFVLLGLALTMLLTAVGTPACRVLSGPEPTPSGPRLPFRDDFDTPRPRWPERADGDAAQGYRDGAFFLRVQAADFVVWETSGGVFHNLALTVEARQISGDPTNSYGAIARYVDENNFYRFDLRGDGRYAVSKLENGQWSLLVDWQTSDAINPPGEVNRIQIVCRETHLTFHANGRELAAVEDASFERGDVGLFASTFDSPPTEVEFDNLAIRPVEEPPP